MRQIDEGNAWQITFYRNFAFFISIGLVLTTIYGRQIFKSIIRIGKAGIIAGIFLAIANISFIHSLENTSVANTLFTLSTIPFITAIIAFFTIEERVSHLTFFLMSIAFLGIALMVSEGLRANEGIGIFLAFCTALSFSCFAVILRKNNDRDMIPCLLLSALLVIFSTYTISFADITIPIKEIAYCIFWGGVLSGFVNAAFIFGTKYMSASEVTLFMLLEFSLGPIWVWLFLNEAISRLTLFGGIIVICCVLLNTITKLKQV